MAAGQVAQEQGKLPAQEQGKLAMGLAAQVQGELTAGLAAQEQGELAAPEQGKKKSIVRRVLSVTICEGKVKGKDPDAHRSESERYLLGTGKIVINRRGSE